MLCSLRSGLGRAVAATAQEEFDDLLQTEGDDEAHADGDEVNEHEAPSSLLLQFSDTGIVKLLDDLLEGFELDFDGGVVAE